MTSLSCCSDLSQTIDLRNASFNIVLGGRTARRQERYRLLFREEFSDSQVQ
jgi:hypothetical protein